MEEIFSKPILSLLSGQSPTNKRTPTTRGGSEIPVDIDKKKEEGRTPVTLWESRFGKPYIANLFEIQSDSFDSLFDKLSPDLTKEMKIVDTFILQQIKKNSLTETRTNYAKILDNLMQMVGVTSEMTTSSKLKKIYDSLALASLFQTMFS